MSSKIKLIFTANTNNYGTLKINGVGQVKLSRYGELFMSEIQNYVY